MARPRKLETDDLIQLVESFYESTGDPAKLKFSLLEGYAVSLGIAVKAYDFKRNEAVRKRMEELRSISDANGYCAIAYKSLDVDAMLNRNYTRQMMKDSLLELDESWRHIFEKAADLSRKNKALLSALSTERKLRETLATEADATKIRVTSLERERNDLIAENRYLKKALKEYLYPAIANEILLRENILEQADTEVVPVAMDALSDAEIPSPFPASVNHDRQMLSREEALLHRMNIKYEVKNNA
jgi:hypothetical protein